jgi:hypothetical protein
MKESLLNRIQEMIQQLHKETTDAEAIENLLVELYYFIQKNADAE